MVVASWFALLVHVAVGVIAWRRLSEWPLVPIVNLAVALCVLGYWATRWYSYIFRGITWYWNDQLIPLYGAVALCLALLSLTGRLQVNWPNVVVFAIHTLVSVAAVLFVSFFRMDRLF